MVGNTFFGPNREEENLEQDVFNSDWGEDEAGWVEETPEEEVDRLIQEVASNVNASTCLELRNALKKLSTLDIIRHTRAESVLRKCKRQGY